MNLLSELKQQLYIMKSLNENKGSKLEYFKKEIIKILENQTVEKSALGVGHVSTYKDGSMWKKIQNNPPKWKCIRQARTFSTETSGAKQSITKLIHKVRDCKNTDELLDIVMFNIDRFRDDKGYILPIVEKLKSEVDIRKVTMTDDKKDAYNNLVDIVNEKNFKENVKLSRDEIFSKYDNTPLKIAKLPSLLQKFFTKGNGFINCGKAYMIDHMVHNHPTTPLPLYRRIQYILDRAKDFYFDTLTGAFGVVEEYGNKKGKPCKNILLFKKDDNDNIILHKTFYDTTKKIPVKFKKYALTDIQQGLTSERVEHTLIGRSGENPAPASGSISGRSDNSNIIQNAEDVKQKIKPENFPERFRENPDMSKVINFIEKGSNNENLNFLFNNLNSILGNMWCFTSSKRAMFSWKNQTVEINKISSEKDINDIETAIHEVAHALDYMCGEKRIIGLNKEQLQATQKDTGLRSVILNSLLKKMPEDTLKLFNKYENIQDGKCELVRKTDVFMDQGNKIKDEYMAGKIDRTTATKQINDINKKITSITKEYEKKINDSGIGHLEDIYDALSGGKFRDSGLISQGHGKSVFSKTDNRTSEIFANYVALSFTQPQLIDNYLRKDVPELCNKFDELIKNMADKQKEKLGVKKAAIVFDNRIFVNRKVFEELKKAVV